MMMKTDGIQSRNRSLQQERPLTGIMMQNSFLSFVIRMFICCLVFWGLFPSASCETACLDKEMKSLLAFKSALHDPAGRLASWNVSLSCCQWQGLSCDSRTGHVVAVDLHHSSLSGAFRPALLVELIALEYLNVGSNRFTGQPIPEELGLLKTLAYLNLSKAGFTGTVPWQLGNLSSLTVLDLSSSPMKLKSDDISWLKNLAALEQLYLNNINISATSSSWGQSVSRLSRLRNLTMTNCALTGSIPPSLLKLTALEILHLDHNTFQSEFPSWFVNMTSLVSLQISYANLTGVFPFEHLSQHPHLKRLSLGNNKISGNVSLFFKAKWKNLNTFNMPSNRLYGSIPSSIENLSSLSVLNLGNNNLNGALPKSLVLLRSLTSLDLGWNNFTGPIPPEICTMLHSLTALCLASNELEGQIPPCICDQTEKLEFLDLSGNKLHGHLPYQFGNCSSLNLLIVSNNSFEGQIPADLGKLKKLQFLHISDNRLNGRIPSTLQNCKMLEGLDVSRNSLSGNVPEWIGDLSMLRILILRSNDLEGEIPIQIGYLPKLQILDLAMNHFSGSIPRHLLNLATMTNESFTRSISTNYGQHSYLRSRVYLSEKGQALLYKTNDLWTDTYMDLSANSLTGPIPVELGYLKGLRSLNLSHNHLMGNIPQELGEMVELESLDISCNQIEGKIPATLAKLTFLAFLNISNNNLSGRIPYIKQLQTFEASSFSGNPELCGLPLQRNCSDRASVDGDETGQSVHWWEAWEAGMGFGWAIGFGSVIGALALSRRLSMKYFRFADRLMQCLE